MLQNPSVSLVNRRLTLEETSIDALSRVGHTDLPARNRQGRITEAGPGAEAAALAFVRCSGVGTELVRVVPAEQAPVPLPGTGPAQL